MPALLTHDFFGRDVFEQIALEGPFDSQDARDLFLLGNQGPDPLFYAQFMLRFLPIKRFGSRLHKEKPDETIESFQRIAYNLPKPEQDLLVAYLLGFICHFTLDSVVHPFIYAQEYALCDAGVKGLDRCDGPLVHAQLEADLDMMMLFQRLGVGIRKFNYTPYVLRASDAGLALLDRAYETMAHEVFSYSLPSDAFSKGIRDMRLSIRLLYSPLGIKRGLIGKLERIFTRHSYAQAMSPPNDIGLTCDSDNRFNTPWVNPQNGAISTASFADLYEQALEVALINVKAVLEGKPGLEITHGLNFDGVHY